MKFRTIVILLLLLVISACTSQVNTNSPDDLQKEREALEKAAQDYIQEQQNQPTITRDFENSFNDKATNADDVDIDNAVPAKDTTTSTSSSSQSSNTKDEEENDSTPTIDIEIYGVDIDFPNDFVLKDDEVNFEPEIYTEGIEEDDFFQIEIIVKRNGREEGHCTFNYIVGGSPADNQCNVDDLPRFDDYDVEIYADNKNKFKEKDEKNNVWYDNFTIDD